ncbi:hypothetical protein BUALT_Bualt02G0140000 [Buddleja alternifolia]|uniref:FMN hydroxy acid dehydrogenase domain-containing protein n=1 Tax=Buddleja alternifolia TaxID=168488 RepID=A0AAV6Y752_9LAMI|nr:hypothetical protein BUALT_Bualt02G0140000 [Buddleja alternifolia]
MFYIVLVGECLYCVWRTRLGLRHMEICGLLGLGDLEPSKNTPTIKVVLAVQGKIPVFFDGGVRRGTDIFKALALGAQAVMIGRPIIYGLAAMGEDGVRRVIDMLKNELELTMALSGCCTVKGICRSHVRTEHDRLECRL